MNRYQQLPEPSIFLDRNQAYVIYLNCVCSALSLLVLIIIASMLGPVVNDAGVLINDASQTMDDFSIMIPEVNKLIQNRKVTIKKWRGIELPRRIETDKTIKEQEQEFLIKTDIEVERTDLFGVIASKAKQSHIDGEALVLTDFDPVADYSNKILVTRQTDPGWSIVFPLIKGLVVERGGMLSHAAIVARELGIPCLIGATNATSLVKDNSKVILNFSTGQISYE